MLGLLQGVTELFPVSSLGHTVVFPALFGWHNLVASESKPESFWLAFVVALHVGTALALVAFFWREWMSIIGGRLHSVRTRTVSTPTERLGWLLSRGDDPGRHHGHSPLSIHFVCCSQNHLRRRSSSWSTASSCSAERSPAAAPRSVSDAGHRPSRELKTLDFKEAGVIGTAQVLALFAGISRSGITMVAGLIRGLNYEDAARFAFLLATPVILAAGLVKLPDLLGPLGNGVRAQALVGALFAFVAASYRSDS